MAYSRSMLWSSMDHQLHSTFTVCLPIHIFIFIGSICILTMYINVFHHFRITIRDKSRSGMDHISITTHSSSCRCCCSLVCPPHLHLDFNHLAEMATKHKCVWGVTLTETCTVLYYPPCGRLCLFSLMYSWLFSWGHTRRLLTTQANAIHHSIHFSN